MIISLLLSLTEFTNSIAVSSATVSIKKKPVIKEITINIFSDDDEEHWQKEEDKNDLLLLNRL